MGLVTTILGFGVVFAVLILISFILIIFGRIMVAATQKEEKTSAKPLPVPVKSVSDVVTESQNLTDDRELVAVITAAIAVNMGDEVSPDRLVVRSLKRVKKSSWKNEAIYEQQNNVI